VSGRDPRERARQLMMASLDGELPEADRRELETMLAGDDELRDEWDKMRRVKKVTETMGYREPPPEVWNDYWGSVYNRTERGVGWLLASIGALLLAGYGLWVGLSALLADSELPSFVKFASFALLFGSLMLLLSVAREKWFVRKSDRYREVQR